MRILEVFALRLRSLFRRRQVDGELDSELQFHLEQQVEEYIAAGIPPNEARYEAMRTVGGIAQLQEECRDMRATAWIENSFQDLKYAMRGLLKTPAFTFVAVLSLALGIGANTAVFSLVQAVLVRSLPYPNPNQLMHVTHKTGMDAVNMLEYAFIRDHSTSFAAVAAHQGLDDQTLTVGGHAEWIKGTSVSGDFFRTLGVTPAMGHEFSGNELRTGGPRSAIITAALWRRAFGSDPSILGRPIIIAGTSFTVVGVLPDNFWFSSAADVFIPLRPSGGVNDEGYNTNMFARLKPGVDQRQADAELASIEKSYRIAYPGKDEDRSTGMSTIPYQKWFVGDVRTNLLLLFGTVLLLLLIACSNLASLLFARLSARQREIAVRLALGSSSGRLLRLFVLENFLLVFAGGAAGLAGAAWSLDALVHLFPYTLPASTPVRLDLTVLTFALAIAAVTGLVFSIVPAIMSSRVKVGQALKSGRSQMGVVRQRIRSILVVTEVALATAMLVAAALLIASLYRQHQEPLGFEPKGVITFWTPPTRERRGKGADLRQFESALSARIRAIPGVRNVGAINALPLTEQNNWPTQREGHPDQSIGGMEIRVVTPSYFETMGIRIVRGRALNDSDSATAPPVVMVNETVAKAWWPDSNPFGDRIQVGRFRDKVFSDVDPAREVVGVVADTKSVQLKQKARPTVYIPAVQANWMDNAMAWVVRGDLSPALTRQLQQAVADVDPRQRVVRVRTMEDIVASTMADSRFDAWLFGFFAALALLLTAIGVYGLLAFFVAQRTAEIGIRLALGATRGGVLRLVLQQSVTLIAIGLALGLGGAFGLTRLFAKLLFGVSATDPWAFAIVAAVLTIVGLAASLLPARRAVRIDPMVALRYE
jgi:putative ABC transport system permease protein